MITFHVGLHKTGTTYLQKEILPQFRGCYVGLGGRGRVADMLRHLAGADDGEYRSESVDGLLAELEDEHGTVLLSRESLSGMLWDEPVATGIRTARRIAELRPGARIVFGIRRQDAMLRSIYAQYVRQGGIETPESFVNGSGGGYTFETGYLEYERLADLYLDAFGADRVLVVPQEQLARDPEASARRIAAFAGGTFDGSCPTRRRNPSLGGPRLDALRRWNRAFRRSRFNPSPRFALPGARAWRYPLHLLQVGREAGTDTPWLELVGAEQRTRYREGNRRVQERTGLDLEGLRYPV